MKVLLSAYECDPTRGSEYGRSWSWILQHLDAGNEVWVLTCIRGREGIEKALVEHPRPNVHFHFVELPAWIEKRYGNGSIIWIYLHYLWFQRKALKTASKLSTEVQFDYIHHISWGSIQMATHLWKLDAPLLYGPIGGGQFPPDGFESYFEEGWSKEQKRKVISQVFERFYPSFRKALKESDLMLAANYETLAMAKQYGAPNARIFIDINLPEANIPAVFPARSSTEPVQIIWVGRILPRKALPLALEALSKLPDSLNWKLTLIGGGEMEAKVIPWIRKYKIEEKVNYLGQIPFEQVKEAYLTHDIFLFCSLRDSSADQFCEAMAHGLPIVTLDIHGGKVIVPEGAGIKVLVDNPSDTVSRVANAIMSLCEDEIARKEMAEYGYQYVKNEVLPVKKNFLTEIFQEPDGRIVWPESSIVSLEKSST